MVIFPATLLCELVLVTGDDEEVVATEDEVVVLGGDVLDVVGVVVLVVLDLVARYAPAAAITRMTIITTTIIARPIPILFSDTDCIKAKPKACSIKS